jgi:acetyl esterase/lipase
MRLTIACLFSSLAAIPVAVSAQGDALDYRLDSWRGRFSIPAGVRVQRDIAYGADPAQRMNVYLPNATVPPVTDPARRAPVLVMVHGGAWRFGDKSSSGVVGNKLLRWSPLGVVIVSVNYRMLPAADPLDQARDVAAALARVQSLAPGWGADPARILLMGHSAGAHLVALLSASPTLAAEAGVRPWAGTVVLDSAAVDVEGIMRVRHLPLYDRAFGNDPALWRAASPLAQLSGPIMPVLAVCSAPRATSCPTARLFAAKATRLGSRSEVLPVDLSHMAINHDLGLPGAYTDGVETFMRSIGILP